MSRAPIIEEDVDILSQILAEQDVVCSMVLAKYSSKPLKERAALVCSLVDSLDDYRKKELGRRYWVIKNGMKVTA